MLPSSSHNLEEDIVMKDFATTRLETARPFISNSFMTVCCTQVAICVDQMAVVQ